MDGCSPEDNAKLIAFLEKEHGVATDCDQSVRHSSVYIPATKLDELAIRYTQFEQRCGQVVITLPQEYHQGFNTGQYGRGCQFCRCQYIGFNLDLYSVYQKNPLWKCIPGNKQYASDCFRINENTC